MESTPFRRSLALLLCVQPIFWKSNVALAQTLQPSPGGTLGVTTPGPSLPEDAEVMRGERPAMGAPVQVPIPVPVPTPPIDQPVNPDAYVCGPGDVLELNFWGIQNFKLRATIDVEGRAFVPRVGYFGLAGKTLSEARRTMRASVGRLFPRLQFDVTLAEPRTFLVQVVDDVVHPGSQPARALDRVATIIAQAGGFGPNASRRRVEIRHRDGSSATADLLLYTLTGDVKQNPFLRDGDVVRVPFEELAASVGGAVNRAGSYELVKTKDLAELVELAGGLSSESTQLLPITLVRRAAEDRPDLKLVPFAPGGGLPALALQSGDRITIPSVGDLQQSVMVVGAIAGASLTETTTAAAGAATAPAEASSTRRLPFVKGDSVRTLLERVGGVGPLADLTGSYLLRQGRTIPVDLYALVMLRNLEADQPVELGDTLMVPFKRRNVVVEGSVFAPGSYPYNPAFGVDQYVSLAGGRSRNAKSIDDVRVITPQGETYEYRPGLKVEPGSSVVVPERNFSRSEVVQIILSAAGIVLSGVAIVIAAKK